MQRRRSKLVELHSLGNKYPNPLELSTASSIWTSKLKEMGQAVGQVQVVCLFMCLALFCIAL